MAKKTLKNYEAILDYMQPNVWYKASELLEVVTVKETRIKVLLTELIDKGLIESFGNTKGKKYKKVTND